jgi:hypothetical protein
MIGIVFLAYHKSKLSTELSPLSNRGYPVSRSVEIITKFERGTIHRGKTNCTSFRMKRLVVISSKDINFRKKSSDLVININILACPEFDSVTDFFHL